MLSTILDLAVILCGIWFPLPEIEVVDESTNPAYQNVYAAAWAAEWEDGSCTISVGQTWSLYSESDKISIMAHEVGHCLGLEHNCDVNVHTIMCQPQLGGVSMTDLNNISAVYGPKYLHRTYMIVGWD